MDEEFIDKLRKGHEGLCPCCGRFSKVYNRTIHPTVALQLIQLYKLQKEAKDAIHTSRLIPKGDSGVGDFTKAKYWDLIEETKTGFWKLTVWGWGFVRQEVRVPKWVCIFNDRVLGHHGKMVAIDDCLGTNYDYRDFMENKNEEDQ